MQPAVEMVDYLKLNWRYLCGAALVHALFAGVFALTMIQMSLNAPLPQLAIHATLVDASQIKPTAKQQQQKEQERQRADKQARDQAAAQERREQEQAAQKEMEQRAEQERQVEVQRRQQQEQQVREREETERKQQAEVEKQQKADTERKRVAEIERKQKDEAARRKAADDARVQAARENELKRQLAEEEGLMSAESAGLNNQYAALIQQQIERNWNRPPSARTGLECEIHVTQSPNGVVLSAQVGKCNGDAAVRQSIEAAVLRASPLPPPPDQRLFQRNLQLIFRPAE